MVCTAAARHRPAGASEFTNLTKLLLASLGSAPCSLSPLFLRYHFSAMLWSLGRWLVEVVVLLLELLSTQIPLQDTLILLS